MGCDLWDEDWVHDPVASERNGCGCEARRGLRQVALNAAIDREYRALERDVWAHGVNIFRLAVVYPEWGIVQAWMECHSGPRVTQARSSWPLWELQARRYAQWQVAGSYGAREGG